jgi:hypothetical protein
LLQHDRNVEERMRSAFPHLYDASEGVMSPPAPEVVKSLAGRIQWPLMTDPVLNVKDAQGQKPLNGMKHNVDVVKKVIRRIERAAQFGLDRAGRNESNDAAAVVDSDQEDESEELE